MTASAPANVKPQDPTETRVEFNSGEDDHGEYGVANGPKANVKPRAGEHTKGPWRIEGPSSGKLKGFDDGGDYAIMFGGHIIAETFRRASETVDYPAEANARRIVACINYLEGISTELLERGNAAGGQTLLAELEAERDQLRAREKELVEVLEHVCDTISGPAPALRRARAALSKVRGA